MGILRISLSVEVTDKATAEKKLQHLKDKLKQSGVKLSASYLEVLQQPKDQ